MFEHIFPFQLKKWTSLMRSDHQVIIRVSIFPGQCIFPFHILSYRTCMFTQLWGKNGKHVANLFLHCEQNKVFN